MPMKIVIIISFIFLFVVNSSYVKLANKTIYIFTETQLQQALQVAKPGDDIVIKDGVYKGNFIIPATANGTVANPIILRGTSRAVLDGGTTNTGYVLHLQASYWVMKGFTISNGLKGLMCDGANYNIVDSLTVNNIGEEAIHFRLFSTHNILKHCTITQTGLKTSDYGEGVYIGSAVSNWLKYTNGKADKCDSNLVINNNIGPNISAECIDVKEGTTGGIISGNYFNSKGITGANSGDSWMDVKGNGYLIESNTGFNPTGSVLVDGYQVHCAIDGWGNDNIFKKNTSHINAKGYGFNITLSGSKGNTTGNKVYNSNVVNGAEKGVANIVLNSEL